MIPPELDDYAEDLRRRRAVAPGTTITLVGVDATVTGRLRTPLGGRVLLTEAGIPVPCVREPQ